MQPSKHLLALLFAALAALAGSSSAQPVPEYQLKAAFVYNFAMFTEWPPPPWPEGSAFNICIRADNPMRPALSELAAKTVKGHRLAVKSWQKLESVQNCQVVMLDAKDREPWKALKSSAGTAGMLTIIDDDAALPGVVITLSLEDVKLNFNVSSSAAREAGLTLSAKLLRLAKSVQ